MKKIVEIYQALEIDWFLHTTLFSRIIQCFHMYLNWFESCQLLNSGLWQPNFLLNITVSLETFRKSAEAQNVLICASLTNYGFSLNFRNLNLMVLKVIHFYKQVSKTPDTYWFIPIKFLQNVTFPKKISSLVSYNCSFSTWKAAFLLDAFLESHFECLKLLVPNDWFMARSQTKCNVDSNYIHTKQTINGATPFGTSVDR